MSQIIGELNWLEQVRVSMVSDMCDMCVQWSCGKDGSIHEFYKD